MLCRSAMKILSHALFTRRCVRVEASDRRIHTQANVLGPASLKVLNLCVLCVLLLLLLLSFIVGVVHWWCLFIIWTQPKQFQCTEHHQTHICHCWWSSLFFFSSSFFVSNAPSNTCVILFLVRSGLWGKSLWLYDEEPRCRRRGWKFIHGCQINKIDKSARKGYFPWLTRGPHYGSHYWDKNNKKTEMWRGIALAGGSSMRSYYTSLLWST